MIETMTMAVEVTENDIARGIHHHSCFCPIALAIKRHFATTTFKPDVVVNDFDIRIGRFVVSTPAIAREFISKFDDYEPVEPFIFEIALKGSI